MNKNALNDAYQSFTQGGYNGSIDDFKQLIATNPNALNDSYDTFKAGGYNGDINSFVTLMGVEGASTIKKKRFDPTNPLATILGESPSESGLSVLQGALDKALPNREKPKSFMSTIDKLLAKSKAKEEKEEKINLDNSILSLTGKDVGVTESTYKGDNGQDYALKGENWYGTNPKKVALATKLMSMKNALPQIVGGKPIPRYTSSQIAKVEAELNAMEKIAPIEDEKVIKSLNKKFDKQASLSTGYEEYDDFFNTKKESATGIKAFIDSKDVTKDRDQFGNERSFDLGLGNVSNDTRYRIKNGLWERLVQGDSKYEKVTNASSITALNNRYNKNLSTEVASIVAKPSVIDPFLAVNSDFLSKTEENAQSALEKKFGNMGFAFEQTGFGTDYIKVTPRNGAEPKTFSFDEKSGDEAIRLQAFLRTNASFEKEGTDFSNGFFEGILKDPVRKIQSSLKSDELGNQGRTIDHVIANNEYYASDEYKQLFKELTYFEKKEEIKRRQTENVTLMSSKDADGQIMHWIFGESESHKDKKNKLSGFQKDLYNSEEFKLYDSEKTKFEKQQEDRYSLLLDDYEIKKRSGDKEGARQAKLAIESGFSKDVIGDNLNHLSNSQYDLMSAKNNLKAKSDALQYKASNGLITQEQYNIGIEALTVENKKLSVAAESVVKSQNKMNALAGVYTAEKAKYGGLGSNMWNAFVVGLDETLNALPKLGSGSKMNITDDMRQEMQTNIITPRQQKYYEDKGYTKEQIKTVRVNQENLRAIKANKKAVIEALGSDLTTEESRADLGIIGSALVGTAASLPSMLTRLIPGAGQAAAFGSMANMSYNAIEEEMLSDPDFETTSQAERAVVAVPYAVVMGYLENLGISKMTKGKSAILGKYILGNFAKAVPKKMGREAVENIVNKEVKGLVSKGVLKVFAGGLAEAETGAMQTLVADIGIKKAYNSLRAAYTGEDLTELTGGEAFGTPQSFSEGVLAVGEGALSEAIGGLAMSTVMVGAQGLATGKISLYNKDDLKFFEDFSSDEEFKKLIVSDLKTKMLEGTMTKSEAQAALNDIDLVAGVFNSIDENLSDDSKIEAFNLINEKRILEKEVEGKDPALSKKRNDRIAEINQELEELPSRIQEDNLTTRAADIQGALGRGRGKTIRLDGKKVDRADAEAELQTIITKLDENAIQKQTASEVLVQPTTTVGEEVVQGEPTAEPQVITEEGKAQEVKKAIENLDDTSWYKIDRLKVPNYTKAYDDIVALNLPTEEYNKRVGKLNKQYEQEVSISIEEAYTKAKKDGSNPELVKAVEELLAPVTQEVVQGEPTAEPQVITEEGKAQEVEYDEVTTGAINATKKFLENSIEKLKLEESKKSRLTRISEKLTGSVENGMIKEYQRELELLNADPLAYFKKEVNQGMGSYQTYVDNFKIKEKAPVTQEVVSEEVIPQAENLTLRERMSLEAPVVTAPVAEAPVVVAPVPMSLRDSMSLEAEKAEAPVEAPKAEGTPTTFSWSKIEQYDDTVIREMMRAQNAKLENLLALKNKTTKAQKEEIRVIKTKIVSANKILDARANKEKRIEKRTEKGEVTDKSPRVSGFDQNGKSAEFGVVIDEKKQTAKVQLKKRGTQEFTRQKPESNLKIQTDKKGRFVETQNKSRVYIDEKVTPPKVEVKAPATKAKAKVKTAPATEVKKEFIIDGKEYTEEEAIEIGQNNFTTYGSKMEYNGNNPQAKRFVDEYNKKSNPYDSSGVLKEDYMKRKISEAFASMNFRKFGDLYRKHIDKYFSRNNKIIPRGSSFQEVAGYTIGDGSYYVDEEQFRAFAKEAGIEIPEAPVTEVKAPVTEVKAPVVEESETEKIYRGAEMLKNMSEDERDNFLDDWYENRIPREALPGGSTAITLYEAKKLVPNPTSKPKRTSIDNAFSLSMEHSFVINIDGVIYGLNKYEDPDATSDALDKYDEPKQYVWAYTNINEGGEVIETNESDIDELINEIKSSKESKVEPVVEPKAEPVKKSTVTAEDRMGVINSIKEDIEKTTKEIKETRAKARKAVNEIEAKILDTKNENQKEELQFDIVDIETQLEEDLEGLKDDLDRQVAMLKEEVGSLKDLDIKKPENKKTLLSYIDGAIATLNSLNKLTYAKLDAGVTLGTLKLILQGIRAGVVAGKGFNTVVRAMATKYKSEHDNKKITIDEFIKEINDYLDSTYVDPQTYKESLEKEIDKFAEIKNAVKQAQSQSRELRKKASNTIKDMLKGKFKSISAVHMKSIMTRLVSVKVENQTQYDKFLEYVDKVIEIADYDTKVKEANVKRKKAKNNTIGKNPKLGDLSLDLLDSLSRMLNINPKLISKEVFDSYYNIVDDLSKRTTILSPGERTDLNEKVNEIVDSIEQNEEMLPDLKDAYDNYANKVVKNGVVDYAKTLTQMLEDGVINNNEFALMKKYKSRIVDAKVKVKMTEQEIADEKAELINEITNTAITLDAIVGDEFRLERELVKRLAKLLNKESLENLDNKQLKDLIKIIENINDGFVSKSTQQMVEILNEKKNSSLLVTSIPKSVKGIFKKITQPIRGVFTRDKYGVNINPLFNIDEVFGDFKTKNIFNSVLNQSAVSQQQFQSEVAEIQGKLVKAESAIASSFNRFSRNENKIVLSKFKMMVYMMQLEFESNPNSQKGDKKQVNQAMKTLDATIKFAETNTETSRYTKEDIVQMKAIKKEFEKDDGFEEDGKTIKKIIDIDKLYNSFNNAEKNALKVFDEVNSLMTKKATYTATVINGNKIAPLKNYIYYNTISDSTMSNERIDGFMKNTDPNQKKGTESKNLEKRTGEVSPVSLDPFFAVNSSAKSVLVNYHMTEPIRTARKTLLTVRKKLEENKKNNENVGEQFEVLSVIEKAYDTATKDLLETNFSESSNIGAIAQYLSKAGYRAMLGSVTRASAELVSNAAFVTINNPKDMAAGFKYIRMANSGRGKNILTNLKSKVISRNYPAGGLSSNYVDLSAFTDRTVRNGKSRNRTINGVKQVYDFSAAKWVNLAEFTADFLIATPDKVVMKQLYFGAFSREFTKETGIEPDFEKIEANDEEYMDKYKDALEKATDKADNQTVTAGSSMNAYMGLLQNVVRKGDDGATALFKTFNQFMNRFTIQEYITARKGVYALVKRGDITQAEGVQVLAAVSARMTLYLTLGKMFSEAIMYLGGLVFGYGDDDDEDEKTYLQILYQSAVSSATTLFFGRNFGNVVRSAENYFIEWGNELYGEDIGLRNGEYDSFKDALQFNQLGKVDELSDFAAIMAGPLGPVINAGTLGIKLATKEAPEEDRAIETRRKEWYRFGLEAAGSFGLVPFYRDIRKVQMEWVYDELKKELKEDAAKKVIKDEKDANTLETETNMLNRMRVIHTDGRSRSIIDDELRKLSDPKYRKEENKKEEDEQKRLAKKYGYESMTEFEYDDKKKYDKVFGDDSPYRKRMAPTAKIRQELDARILADKFNKPYKTKEEKKEEKKEQARREKRSTAGGGSAGDGSASGGSAGDGFSSGGSAGDGFSSN